MFCLHTCMCDTCVSIGSPGRKFMDDCELHVILRISTTGTSALNHPVISLVPELYHFQK